MNTQFLKLPSILYLFSCLIVSLSVFAASDSDITSAVKSRLKADSSLSSVSVKTDNGIVSLSGKVSNESQYDNAVQAASSVAGVQDVNTDDLKLGDNSQTSSDTLITAKVKGAFIREKLFGSKTMDVTGISVTTQNGVVSLSGTADSQTQINNAISIAKKVKGVTDVQSSVTVKQ